jgi:hypothetical protein
LHLASSLDVLVWACVAGRSVGGGIKTRDNRTGITRKVTPEPQCETIERGSVSCPFKLHGFVLTKHFTLSQNCQRNCFIAENPNCQYKQPTTPATNCTQTGSKATSHECSTSQTQHICLLPYELVVLIYPVCSSPRGYMHEYSCTYTNQPQPVRRSVYLYVCRPMLEQHKHCWMLSAQDAQEFLIVNSSVVNSISRSIQLRTSPALHDDPCLGPHQRRQ